MLARIGATLYELTSLRAALEQRQLKQHLTLCTGVSTSVEANRPKHASCRYSAMCADAAKLSFQHYQWLRQRKLYNSCINNVVPVKVVAVPGCLATAASSERQLPLSQQHAGLLRNAAP
eukprot:20455-Heterococcus_DN1.PRE.6